jgi:hypothetical protein
LRLHCDKVDATPELLIAMLRSAWNAAPQQANTLAQALENAEQAALANFITAGSLTSVSKNSASQSYFRAGLGTYTIPQIQSFWTMLVRLYYRIKQKTDWLYVQNVPWFITQYVTNAPAGQDYKTDPDYAIYTLAISWLGDTDWDNYQIDLTELRMFPTQLGINGGALTW